LVHPTKDRCDLNNSSTETIEALDSERDSFIKHQKNGTTDALPDSPGYIRRRKSIFLWPKAKFFCARCTLSPIEHFPGKSNPLLIALLWKDVSFTRQIMRYQPVSSELARSAQ
jgi:hypothetical protein